MSGGFGLCGNPENLIEALLRRGTRELTLISNNCGTDGKGLGKLLQNGQVRKMIASYVGENKTFERMFLDGKLEVELFRKTARNFNPVMATAARITIAEVEQLVEPGEIPADQIHTPGIFVRRIFQGANYVKPIEQRTVRPRPTAAI